MGGKKAAPGLQRTRSVVDGEGEPYAGGAPKLFEMEPTPQVKGRLSNADVDRMVDEGAFDEGPRVELLDGALVEMTPQGPAHGALTEALAEMLQDAFGAGWHVRRHSDLVLGAYDRPEPDIAVIRGRARDYLARHPTPRDVVLVVEIANSSHARDRHKASLYARWGIPVYWILDIVARAVVVHRRPGQAGYADVTAHGEGDAVGVPVVGATWQVCDLLP